jgi:hypothetical protein
MVFVVHPVRINGTTAAMGAAALLGSIRGPGTPANTGPHPTGQYVRVAGGNAEGTARAAQAAWFWNNYDNGSYAGPTAVVAALVVADWADTPYGDLGPGTVGLATGYTDGCAPGFRGYICRDVTLYAHATYSSLAFDVFVHEIGHVLIPPGAETCAGGDCRVLDGGHHWNPHQPKEIFGPYIDASPSMAAYTARAADPWSSRACDADSPCPAGSNTTCTPTAYTRAPGVCAAPGGAPGSAHDHSGHVHAGDDDGASTAWWLAWWWVLALLFSCGVLAFVFAVQGGSPWRTGSRYGPPTPAHEMLLVA